LRTHVMRPTWHFVAAADIKWMLELTAPRVHAISAYYYRQINIDAAVAAKCREVLSKELEGGKALIRTEIAEAFERNNIDTKTPLRFGYLLMHAELDGFICSGPLRGKQHTYMLLSERAPQATALERDEALALLVRRFFTSHGPALIKDFVWWSGLTVADTKRGLELAKDYLNQEDINGQTYWFAADMQHHTLAKKPAFLLPSYDEYGVAYKDHSAFLTAETKNVLYNRRQGIL
jgi:hypothetical protein